MASVNKVILVGNLGRDPEVRYTQDGAAICNLSLATSYQWKDKASGQRKEEVEWHRVVLFNRLAEIAGEYLSKGRSVYIEGRLRTRKWQDKETGADRYSTEIVADQMQMLGGRDDSGAQNQNRAPQTQQRSTQAPQTRQSMAQQAPAGGALADMSDDIPFNRLGAGRVWAVI